MLSKEDILKEKSWKVMFGYPKTEKELRKNYLDYAKIYHQDVAPDCVEVFKALVKLYKIGKAHFDLNSGKAKLEGIKATSTDGKIYSMRYILKRVEFEQTSYLGKEEMWIVFGKGYSKYYDNYLKMVKDIKYADKPFKEQFERLMPKIKANFKTKSGNSIIILSKTSEVISIQDVIDADIDRERELEWIDRDRHCAWILSRLYNLACFLNYNNLVFNGLNLRNVYISPTFHSALLLNGWQFTNKKDEKMLGTTKDIYDIMSIKCKDNKISEYSTDLESIKMIGRRIFTDKAPKPILEFIEKASSGDCFKDWNEYNKVLDEAYGKRTFIGWNFDITDLVTI